MTPAPTVDDLFATFHERLALTWAAGRAGGRCSIDIGDDPRLRTLLVGYLNLINPKKIQILGHTEIAHLESLDHDQLPATVATICAVT